MHRRVLITGISGSGKTYLARYFRRRSLNAYDGDAVHGLAKWVNGKGRAVSYPKDASQEWLSRNYWVWSERRLRALLNCRRDVFVFGIPHNLYDIVTLFNEAYYLKASRALIHKRLASRGRDNDFGKAPHQMRMILAWKNYADRQARMAGLRFIDASLPPSRIMRALLRGWR